MGLNLIRLAFDPDYRALKRFRWAGNDALLTRGLRFASDDVVLEGGAFRGTFTRALAECGAPRVISYEPVPDFFAEAQAGLSDLPNVDLRCAGLSDRNGDGRVALAGESTSAHRPGVGVPIRLERASDVVRGLDGDLALLALNVEGEEYPILENLLAEGLVPRIRSFLVQFHRIGPDSEGRYEAIAAALSRTHVRVWRYAFVWERWERR